MGQGILGGGDPFRPWHSHAVVLCLEALSADNGVR